VQAHLLAVVLIAVGGALGAVARFWMSGFVARRVGETFPWGTLAVNVSGAAIIGIVAGRLLDSGLLTLDSPLWLGMVTGILGSFTTVSSFSLQTMALMRSGEWARAGWNVAASLTLCLGAAAGGFALGAMAS
jgi:CrcB protein